MRLTNLPFLNPHDFCFGRQRGGAAGAGGAPAGEDQRLACSLTVAFVAQSVRRGLTFFSSVCEQVWVEGPVSLKIKYDWLQQSGYKGFGIWVAG